MPQKDFDLAEEEQRLQKRLSFLATLAQLWNIASRIVRHARPQDSATLPGLPAAMAGPGPGQLPRTAGPARRAAQARDSQAVGFVRIDGRIRQTPLDQGKPAQSGADDLPEPDPGRGRAARRGRRRRGCRGSGDVGAVLGNDGADHGTGPAAQGSGAGADAGRAGSSRSFAGSRCCTRPCSRAAIPGRSCGPAWPRPSCAAWPPTCRARGCCARPGSSCGPPTAWKRTRP